MGIAGIYNYSFYPHKLLFSSGFLPNGVTYNFIPEQSGLLGTLPEISCSFPLTLIVECGSILGGSPICQEFLSLPLLYGSSNPVSLWWSGLITLGRVTHFSACLLSGMRFPEWSGSSLNLQYWGIIVESPERSIPLFGTKASRTSSKAWSHRSGK